MSLPAVAAEPLEPSPACASGRRRAELTYVELVFFKGRMERWIRFGRVADEHVVTRRNRFVGFDAGAVFAFVRWASNDVGTVVSRIDILQAVRRTDAWSTVPGVTPGGEILLRQSGWPKVQRVLQAVDVVEALGVDPADAAPEHWRHVHHRLSAGEAPRAYSRERHRAWLLRQEVAR